VSFPGNGDNLSIGSAGDFNFLHNGATDWTVEFWAYTGTATRQFVWGTTGSSLQTGFYLQIMSAADAQSDATGVFALVGRGAAGNYIGWGANNCLAVNTWHHIAAVFKSSDKTLALYVDGREVDNDAGTVSGTFAAANYSSSNSSYPFTVGKNIHGNSNFMNGYISNLRVVAGRRLYTSDFTPPVHALEVIGGTVLLCCNNSDTTGNAFDPTAKAEATGKIITITGIDIRASTFSPPLTRDFTGGTEFSGVTVFDTQGYFVPPSGTTEQQYVNVASNAVSAARGVFMGGLSSAPGSVQDVMDYVTITSTGNAVDFGNLTAATRISSSCSSTTRGVRMGGFSDPAAVDVIDYVTIASTGNAQDFGNLTSAKHSIGGSSNSTRGLSFGSSGLTNTIEYITIASTGDSKDFGDMVDGLGQVTGTASPTRCVMAGGEAPTRLNTMQYVTIMTMGNAFDFGDLTIARSGIVSLSSATRGLYLGGELPASPSFTNTVDFIQIATTGNAINFGDLDNSNGMRLGATAASPTRGLYAGGGNDQPVSNTAFAKIHLFTIASTGNATDFGDITVARFQMNNGTVSSGHGGLG
jgi:hypothetical protein